MHRHMQLTTGGGGGTPHHPCQYEHFRKLKFLNHKIMQARIKHAASIRYWQKDPDNRVHKRYERNEMGQRIRYSTVPMTEPDLCPVFNRRTQADQDGLQQRSTDVANGVVIRGTDLDQLLLWTIDPGVEEDYRRARFPKENPSDLQPLKLSKDQVNALVALFPDNPWANEHV